jgi:hypothetical protein
VACLLSHPNHFRGVFVTNWHHNDVKYCSTCSSWMFHASHATSFFHILKRSMNELCSCLLSHICVLGCHHTMTGVTEFLSATLLSSQLTFPTRIWLERGPKHQCIRSIHHTIPQKCCWFGRQQLHMKTLMS